MTTSRTNRFRRVTVPAVAALTTAALALAGCSGDPNAASNTDSGGSSAAGADYAAMLTTATKLTPDAYAGPTTAAKAPAGKKIAAITCYSVLEGCVIPADGIAKAAKIVGWEARTFDGGGTPTNQNKQILNAVSWGADVIALIAITPSAVQTGLRAAEAAGIKIVSGSSGLSTPNAVIAAPGGEVWPAFDVSPDYKQLGTNIANWIVADSGGKANVLVYGDKEFDSINAQETGVVPALKACTTCTVSDVQYFTATQIASALGPQTVSYLRTHPDVNYIYSAFDPPAAAQVQAIVNAGMAKNVKIASALGNSQNLKFIQAGQVQAADAAYDNIYMGFAIVDQSIRLLNGEPLIEPAGEGLPFQVLTKDTLPASLDSWVAPFSYEDKFTALWK
jgi:ABC-type sugar transport system substrate-binding protein